MELEIKQLKHGSYIFAPQTTAEAVLVKRGDIVIRLDEALTLKSGHIITPVSSGLKSFQQDDNVVITHSNNVEAVEQPSPLMIAYDQHGHVTKSTPLNKLNVTVNETSHIEFTGAEEKSLNFGDDFTVENNKIKLNWIEHGNT